ncbi:hypothetical protein TNCV_662971 [Trichonephila clavipes]|nr:hypothetical protein TNCV_662971 [Trichonephila clavipes]
MINFAIFTEPVVIRIGLTDIFGSHSHKFPLPVSFTAGKFWTFPIAISTKLSLSVDLIVRVQYFVRGGSVGHRSRASSKHLSPHLPVNELDSSGGQTGLALHLQMHVWVSGPQRKPTRC